VGGFAVGQEPTGSSDPFALRRQANGIVKVLVDFSLPISPIRSAYEVAVDSLKLFGNVEMRDGAAELKGKLEGFFRERLAYYLESICGFRYDTVRAVVAAGADHPADAHARAQAMDSLRGGEDFEALSAAAKRIRNILTKSASAADWQAGEVDAALLGEADEQELYNAYRQVVGETRQGAGEGSAAARGPEEYRRALEAISMLRPTVDRFFDKVLVMAEDPGVRQNRLRLLKKLDELFSGIAHFAEIEGK
jgi:glycyl-tRNA synthetase beta chain